MQNFNHNSCFHKFVLHSKCINTFCFFQNFFIGFFSFSSGLFEIIHNEEFASAGINGIFLQCLYFLYHFSLLSIA